MTLRFRRQWGRFHTWACFQTWVICPREFGAIQRTDLWSSWECFIQKPLIMLLPVSSTMTGCYGQRSRWNAYRHVEQRRNKKAKGHNSKLLYIHILYIHTHLTRFGGNGACKRNAVKVCKVKKKKIFLISEQPPQLQVFPHDYTSSI